MWLHPRRMVKNDAYDGANFGFIKPWYWRRQKGKYATLVGYGEWNLTSSNKLSLVDIREESEIPTFLGHQIKRDYGHIQAQYFYKY